MKTTAIPTDCRVDHLPRLHCPGQPLDVVARIHRLPAQAFENVTDLESCLRTGRTRPNFANLNPTAHRAPDREPELWTGRRRGAGMSITRGNLLETRSIEAHNDFRPRRDHRHAHLATATHHFLGRALIDRNVALNDRHATLAKELLRSMTPWSGRSRINNDGLMTRAHHSPPERRPGRLGSPTYGTYAPVRNMQD